MKRIGLFLILAVMIFGMVGTHSGRASPVETPAAALGTAFTYQGRLAQSGSPANGIFDFRFTLFDALTGGNQVGSVQSADNLSVTDGYFSVRLDFETVFDGRTLWLEAAVRPDNDTLPYTVLGPRQELTAAPYALFARSSPWSGLSGVPSGFVDGVDNDTIYAPGAGLILSGTTFSADTAYLQRRVGGSCTTGNAIRSINADGTVTCVGKWWNLGGNNGTTPGIDYLGTSDNQALELRVNGTRALRLEPNPNSPNVIGGLADNGVTPGVYGTTLFGGSIVSGVSYPNRITDLYGTISGGVDNLAGNKSGTIDDAVYATVGGGVTNQATGERSTIAGGTNNLASGLWSTISGGGQNNASATASAVCGGGRNNANGEYSNVNGGGDNIAGGLGSSIGGGLSNVTSANYATIGGGGSVDPLNGNQVTDEGGTVGGGVNNQAGNNTGTNSDAYFATVGGGADNQASGAESTVGGGANNKASGWRSTVGGGVNNQASGWRSTVGGGDNNVASGFLSMVPGGINNTAGAHNSFAAGTRAKANHEGSFVWADANEFDFPSMGYYSFNVRATGGFNLILGINPTTGSSTWACQLFNGQSWSCSSDRNLKENFQFVDGQKTLEKLSLVPLATWNAKGTDPNVKHLGPTAQDFYAAFGLGDSDVMISTIDLDGVALSAIQGLYQINQEQAAEIQALLTRLEKVEAGAVSSSIDIPWGWVGACGFFALLVLAQAGMFISLRRKLGGEK